MLHGHLLSCHFIAVIKKNSPAEQAGHEAPMGSNVVQPSVHNSRSTIQSPLTIGSNGVIDFAADGQYLKPYLIVWSF
jgi:hypothetical protein